MNITLAAFGLFGDYIANSSEQVARSLNGARVSGFQINSIVFPCVIPTEDRGQTLLEKARSEKSSGIIALGMGSEQTGFCFESFGQNETNNPKYCPPELNGTRIESALPNHARALLDLEPWQLDTFACHAQKIGLPTKISRDPGGFCCNHLIFQTRRRQLLTADALQIPFAFIHIPCSPEAVAEKDKPVFARAGKVTLPISKITQGLALLLKNARLTSQP